MHDIAVKRITSEDIGDDLAESHWKKTFIQVPDGRMNIFLLGGNASL
jgi:hypothetical protein